MFAKSFIDDMFEVCKLFGPKAVLFMSNDDKARVSLGLTATSLQTSLLCIWNTRKTHRSRLCRWPTAQVDPIGVWHMRS